jgi:hypothetical protein
MSKKSILFFKKEKNLNPEIDFSIFSIIIPLDYESAIYLDSLKISYNLPETYVSMKEYWEIDNLAIKLGRSLWKIKNKNLISFKEINIPDLFHLDNTINIIKLLKKFFEYNKIIELESPDEIFNSVDGNTFDDIPKFLALNKKIKYIALNTKYKSISHFDNIPIQIKFGGKIFLINQNQFKKIKNFSEFIIKKLPKNSFQKNSLLLIDFNLVLYENFIENLEKNGINVTLLNSRRPVVWNRKSLEIQLSKKYNIDYLSNYFNKESKDIVKNKTEEITENFLSVIKHDEFNSQFKINNIEFGNLLYDEFLNYFPQKIYDSVKDIETSSKFLNNDFSHILVWAYQLPFEKIIMNLASQMNISVSAIQDGVKGRFSDPLFGVMENYNDYDSNFKNFFAWGKDSKEYYLNAKIPQNKIVLSGSPLYDAHFKLKINQKPSNTILFATSGLGLALDSNTISRTKKYQSFIELVCETIPKLNHKKLAIKLHPFADERIDIPNIAREINPDIHIYKHENIINLISNADLVISSHSTVILESMILGKPTMVWLPDDYYESIDLRYIKSGASLKVDLKNFKTQIDDFYNNPEIRKNLLKNSTFFIKDYLTNPGQSSSFLSNYLQNN